MLDTDIASMHQREQAPVTARIARLPSGTVGTTTVTMYEQFRGRLAQIERARDGDAIVRAYRWLEETRAYYCGMPILSFDEAAAVQFRSLVAQQLRVGTQDLRIAAVVLVNDIVLVTRNRRDFERVAGLRVEDWTVE